MQFLPAGNGGAGAKVLGEKFIYFHADFLGFFAIQPIKTMATGEVFVNLVFKFLVFSLKGLDEVFNLQPIDIFIVGIGVDLEGRLQFFGIPNR